MEASRYDNLKNDGERLAAAIWIYKKNNGVFPQRIEMLNVRLIASSLDRWTYAPSATGFILNIYTGRMREMLIGEWKNPSDGQWEISPDD